MYQVLALDPSFTATGWVIMDKDEHRIIKSGVFAMPKMPFNPRHLTSLKIYQQNMYYSMLSDVLDANKYIKEIYSEYPHGAKESKAANSFAVTTSTIIGLARSRNIPLEFCLESQSKICVLHHAKNTSKEEMRGAILAIYEKNGYIEDKAKYKAEAIADALAVYTYFRYNKKGL